MDYCRRNSKRILCRRYRREGKEPETVVVRLRTSVVEFRWPELGSWLEAVKLSFVAVVLVSSGSLSGWSSLRFACPDPRTWKLSRLHRLSVLCRGIQP